jgi:hypothetical protein
VAVGAVHLLRQKLSHHSIMTSLAHRQRQFISVQPNDLAAPSAFDRRRELLSNASLSTSCALMRSMKASTVSFMKVIQRQLSNEVSTTCVSGWIDRSSCASSV